MGHRVKRSQTMAIVTSFETQMRPKIGKDRHGSVSIMAAKLSLLIIALLTSAFCEENPGYIWRNFTGTIPLDAIQVGQNPNGSHVYIAQAIIGEDISVTQILNGQETIELVYYTSTRTVNSGIKILCGPEHPVEWILTDSDYLHSILIGRHAVIGGSEGGVISDGVLYIGRTSYKNEIKIGKITAWKMNDARLHFHHEERPLVSRVFEVLVYDSEKSRKHNRWIRRGHKHRIGIEN